MKRITNKQIKILGGVCAGIALERELPVTLIRVIALLITMLTGFLPIMIIYTLLWIGLPTLLITTKDFNEKTRPKSFINLKNKETEIKNEKIDLKDMYSEVEEQKEINK